jgi:NAD(P)-dependent dehydrogenase (short-subunit alcohol dehydrogenase family)
LPEGTTFQQCNVKVWSDIVKLFRETRKLHGSIDVVCANAGIADRENLLGDNEEEPAWDVLDVNLKGVMMSISHRLNVLLTTFFSVQSSGSSLS